MARSNLALLFLFGLACHPASAQTTTITGVDDVSELPAGASTDTANTNYTTVPCSDLLTEKEIAGLNLTKAQLCNQWATACADPTSEGFCSACLCSINTALIADSPLVPALLTAVSPESMAALSACNLTAAALTCGLLGGNSTQKVQVVAAQGPAPVATPVPVPNGVFFLRKKVSSGGVAPGLSLLRTPESAQSSAGGIVAAALFAVPVAVALAFITY